MPYVEYDEVEAACSDCGRTFHSQEALEAHLREAHDPVEEAGAPNRGSRPEHPGRPRRTVR